MLSVGFGNTPYLKNTKNVSISKKILCLYALKYLNFGTKYGIKMAKSARKIVKWDFLQWFLNTVF